MAANTFLLTQDVGMTDFPIWKGSTDHAPEEDNLYFLGANFIFWQKTPKGHYFPKIIYPVANGLQCNSFPSFAVSDPGILVFLPGKTLDVILQRVSDVSNKVKGYIIKNGAIERLTEYQFERELAAQLYGDKYLVVLFNDSVHLININYPSTTHKIEGIPPDGSLAVYGDTAVVWSRLNSARISINLVTKKLGPITPLDALDADEVIKATTVDCMATRTPTNLRMYNSSGRRILDLPVQTGLEFEKEGILDSCNSRTIAVAVKSTIDQQRTVYWYSNSELKSLRVGSINCRALVLINDAVYGAFDELKLTDITLLPTLVSNPKQTFDTAGVGNYRVHRYLRISSGGGWILESFKHPTNGQYELIIRALLGYVLKPSVCTKRLFPETGPIVTTMDIIPAFMYESNGIVRIWVCETMEMKNQTSVAVKQPKTYIIRLYLWDKVADRMEPTSVSYELLDLPQGKFHARWFKTDKWVVLTMGNMAYIFNFEGSKSLVKPLIVPSVHINARGPVSIMQVRGFDRCLWFLSGYLMDRAPLIWQASVWDGADDVFVMDLDKPIHMTKAVATGMRNPTPSGRRLFEMELIVSSVKDGREWLHLKYEPDSRKYSKMTFACEGASYLCETPDVEGRIYFSRDHEVYIYIPGTGYSEKFSTTTQVDVDKYNLARPANDKIQNVQVGFRKVWVSSPGRFYVLDNNLIQQTHVKERLLPVKPLASFDLHSFHAEFQVPTKISTYPSTVDERDLEAVFENDEYLWLSTQPVSIYFKPLMLRRFNHPAVVFLENGRMLVLVTLIEEHTQQREKQSGIEIETQDFNGQPKQVKYAIYEILI